MHQLLIVLLTLAVSLPSTGRSGNVSQSPSQLEVEISGAHTAKPGKRAITDGDGIHFGKCMKLLVKNRAQRQATFSMKQGDVLFPLAPEDSVQQMLVTANVQVSLGPNEPRTILFYAMCAQMPLLAPNADVKYNVGQHSDSSLSRLAAVINRKGSQDQTGQYAVWMVSDRASVDDLLSHGATGESLSGALELLDEAATPISFDQRAHISLLSFLTMTCGLNLELAQYAIRIAFVLIIYAIIFKWIPAFFGLIFKRRRVS